MYFKLARGTAREERAQILAIDTVNKIITLRGNLTNTHLASDADTFKNCCLLSSTANVTVNDAAVAYQVPVFKIVSGIAA